MDRSEFRREKRRSFCCSVVRLCPHCRATCGTVRCPFCWAGLFLHDVYNLSPLQAKGCYNSQCRKSLPDCVGAIQRNRLCKKCCPASLRCYFCRRDHESVTVKKCTYGTACSNKVPICKACVPVQARIPCSSCFASWEENCFRCRTKFAQTKTSNYCTSCHDFVIGQALPMARELAIEAESYLHRQKPNRAYMPQWFDEHSFGTANPANPKGLSKNGEPIGP